MAIMKSGAARDTHGGKKGTEIPLLSRIIAVAEAYDRVYNSGELPPEGRAESALKVIRDGAGTQFDPQLADMFLRLASNERDLD
ncbi:MAG: hypothetical protein PHP02_05245 [Eubacteriales bacterium]|nr:hypothetical protein [Eubacteriales bacterium]